MNGIELSKSQIKNLATPLVDKVLENVEEFYRDSENEKRFRTWYEATYGKPVPKGV